MNKYNAQIGAGGTQYAYYHEEDESSFQLVGTKEFKKPSLLVDNSVTYVPIFNKSIKIPFKSNNKFQLLSRLIPQGRYVQCTAEEDSSEEEFVVVEGWVQAEGEHKDGMPLRKNQLLRCKFLARHRRTRNGK